MIRRGKRKRVPFRNRPFKKPRRARIRRYRPGFNRVGGFYGRYAPSGTELKFHDVNLDDVSVSSSGTVTPTINIIPIGTGESDRIGRKCTITAVNWKFRLDLPIRDALALPADLEEVRVVLFLDKQCNGATAAVLDLIETADVRSYRNLSNSGRFVFLHDKIYSLNYNNLASDGAGLVSSTQKSMSLSVYKKCNIPIEYNSTAGAITEIRSNNLGVLLISANATVGFESRFRLRFSDN